MNRIIFTQDEMGADGTLHLNDQRAAHIIKILQARLGDVIRVGMVDGLCGTAEIEKISSGSCILRPHLTHEPPAPSPVTLTMALPRPKVARRIISFCASAGIQHVVFFRSWRVEKSYFQSPLLSPESLDRAIREGLSQGGGTRRTKVEIIPLFTTFLDDHFPVLRQGKNCYLAHPGKGLAAEAPAHAESLLCIGPEGGFIEREVRSILEAGCIGISPLPWILRSEDAVPWFLGYLTAIR